MTRLLWRAAAALLIALIQPAAHAQAFPNQPLHIIVGGPAGSVDDTHARKIADKLAAALGQPVLIDNRPGASGNIAADLAARAKPDGHTLLFTNNGVLGTNPAVFAKLPYDPLRSFAPVSGLVRAAPLLLVNPQLPVRTLAELIACEGAAGQAVIWFGGHRHGAASGDGAVRAVVWLAHGAHPLQGHERRAQ